MVTVHFFEPLAPFWQLPLGSGGWGGGAGETKVFNQLEEVRDLLGKWRFQVVRCGISGGVKLMEAGFQVA